MQVRNRVLSQSFKKTTLPLNVLIIGAGIAGLASAYALGKSGHKVRVLESSSDSNRASGGIRIPPNLSKILKEWGLGSALQTMQRCRKSSFRSLKDGELLGYLEWQEDVLKETGGDFLLAHHAELHQLLYQLACSVETTFSFGSIVTSLSVPIEASKENPWVILEDGTTIVADVIIGADGAQSVVRDIVNGPMQGEETGHSFYTVTIPADKLQSDLELAKWVDMPEWPIWMGDSRSVLGYPIQNGSSYCIHIYWPDDELINCSESKEGWDVTVSTSVINFDGYDPIVRKLFTAVPEALRTKYVKRQKVEDWVDETGRIILLGEAAHPLLPCTIHGASLAVEDAVVLGVLMAQLRSRNQIPQLTAAFQDIRQDRCNQVIDSELNNAALVTLPPGEQRHARDAALRSSLDFKEAQWNENQLRDQWDEIGDVFGYNARETAEDWWVKWGTLTDSCKTFVQHSPDLRFEVTKSEIRL
ncbi:hypothetical protein AMATHDRAFT_82406 [Amanita thiersii Skay4041]|uniref:FAD-binding domain-containing protein n=1 Tax=Amanita thiersii Skay4041 TaxID=703135 RepID=A0A2A9NF44_9AGAR|nr:hypothetical protein AMATHDRAFT_82406 [Amanita thiersii Skay4041]